MSRTFSKLPNNRNDKENNRFGLTSEGKVGVRVLDSTLDSSGKDLSATLIEEVRLLDVRLSEMNVHLEKIVNHMRAITGHESEKGDTF